MNYLESGACTGGSNKLFSLFSNKISRCTGILPLLLLLGAGAAQAKPDVTFIDRSSLAAVDIPVTFAQVFAPGDVPAGLSVTVDVGGNPLPTQVDGKAVHADGSLRHAVITTRLPTLGAGQSLAAEIVTSDPAVNGPAVSAADLLATPFDTVIELTLDGVVYTASARDALLADSSRRWLEGPLVTEFTLRRAFATADGSTHPHLMARFDVRAYQGLESVRVDAIVENNWTYVPGPRNFTYDVRVLVGGAEAYSLSQLTHYQRARWHKVFWWGKEPGVYTRHDTRYLQATRAVPHYDPDLAIPEAVLEAQGQVQYTPMSNVEINDYMPEAGPDKGIGPLPRWAARYLISGDPRAYHGVLANGDAGGSYSAHYRDIDTDLPVSLDDYPYVTGDKYQYPKDHIVALCETDCASPLTRDTAHQPSIAFLPYLLTGDHYYLEELLFWANGNLISSSIGTREGGKGILRGQQVRGQAWSLRTLAQAAYIAPDAHPMKAYFNAKLQNNIDYYLGLYADNPAANKLGSLPHHNDLDTAAPWMDDFFTWAVGYTVELGYSDFQPMLAWKSKYPVGRMASPDNEFCWIFGGVYQLAIGVAGDKTDPANWFQSLNEVYLNNFGNRQNSDGVYVRDMPCAGQEMADWLADFDRNKSSYLPGEMYGYSDSPVGYPANLQPALALAVDHGIANAGLAWQRLTDRAKFPDYSSNPQFAVTPRSLAADYSGPLVSFSASAITVDPGNSGVTLSWQASGADDCTASGNWSGGKALSGSYATGNIDADAIYTLSCSNASGGNTTRSVVVSFNGTVPAPVVNFGADRTSIAAGGSVTLTWFSGNADSCMASGGWSGAKALSGTFETGAINADVTYTLNCSGAGGSTSRSVTVSVSGATSSTPIVNLNADKTRITAGDRVMLTWTSSNTDSCVASGAWSGGKATSGSQTIAPDESGIYTLTCTGNGGSAGTSVNITVDTTVSAGGLAEQVSGAGAFGLWSLLLLAMTVAWGTLREKTTHRCRAAGALARGVAVACALAVVPAQAAVPGLVLHWDFDTASGTTIGDASGSGNDGNSANTPVLVPGKLGQAMRFDDVARDTVGLAVGNFPDEEFSLSLWLRSSDSNGGSTLVSYRSNDRKTSLFKLWGINNLQVMVNGDHVKDTGVAVGDGQWHHLAVNWARRNGVLTLYKNGVRVFQAVDVNRTQALASSGFLNAGVDVQKWSTDWGNAYGGDMDDLRIYNRLLSEDEISWLASATPLSDTQPPAPVSGFQAVAVSPRESYLRWEAPADNRFVAGYRVYRGGVLAGATGDTAFVDEGMTPGANHRYTVVAFDGAGNDAAASQAVTVQAPASGSVLDALPPGHWYEIKDSSVWTQLGVNPDVMGSWSGGIYDTKRERLVIWGGGHMNYDGNELYGFDFNTFSWSQLTPITPRDQRTRSVDVYADGLPSSRHTYNGLQYIPTIDRFFSSGGALYGSGGCSGGTWLYDFDAVPAESGWQNIADDKGGCAMISAYDPITGHVWYSAGSKLFTFDPLNLSAPWTQRLSGMEFDFYMSAAIDPARRKLVLLGGTGYGGVPKTVVYDIANPAAVTGGVASTQGATEIENSDAAGFEFDPVSDRFVAWNGGGHVYTLTPDTLKWSRMAPAATNLITPSAPAGMGTYGRFRYIPSKNVFVVVNDMEQNVFVYKLSEGSGSSRPFPSLEFTAGSTSVSAGSTVDLVWAATDADSCTAAGGWSGNKALTGSETVGPLSESTSFILRCSSEVGDAVRQVEVAVSAGVPSVSLEGSTSSILAGESLTLSWSSLNTDTCTAGGGWSGAKASSGSQVVTPGSDSTYSLTCTGSGGSASASFEVSVSSTSDPIVSIGADDRNLVAGSTTTLRWSSANVDGCVASGAWDGPRATSGSQAITPDSDSTYSLSCTSSAGDVESSVVITITAPSTRLSDRGGVGAWGWWGLGAMLLLLFARFALRRQRFLLAG